MCHSDPCLGIVQRAVGSDGCWHTLIHIGAGCNMGTAAQTNAKIQLCSLWQHVHTESTHACALHQADSEAAGPLALHKVITD